MVEGAGRFSIFDTGIASNYGDTFRFELIYRRHHRVNDFAFAFGSRFFFRHVAHREYNWGGTRSLATHDSRLTTVFPPLVQVFLSNELLMTAY